VACLMTATMRVTSACGMRSWNSSAVVKRTAHAQQQR
jgi:hypothetical protein